MERSQSIESGSSRTLLPTTDEQEQRQRQRQTSIEQKNIESSFWSNLKISFTYVIFDTNHQRRSFVIGVMTVFIVVCFLSLIQNALERSPVIFVKLAEDQVGQFDLLFTPEPNSDTTSVFLNYTYMNETLSSVSSLKGTAPRWVTLGEINSPSTQKSTKVVVVVQDTDLEKSIGLGSSWSHRALGRNEIHLTASTVRDLGLKPQAGQRVTLSMDFLKIFSNLGLLDTSNLRPLLESLIQQLNPDINLNQTITLDDLQRLIPGPDIPNLPNIPITDLPNQINFTIGNNTFAFNVSDIIGINPSDPSQTLFELIGLPTNTSSLIDIIVAVVQNAIDSNLFTLNLDSALIDAVEYPEGKYPVLLGNVVIVERMHFENTIKDFIKGLFNTNNLVGILLQITGVPIDQINTAIDSVNMNHYSFLVIGLLRDRTELFSMSSKKRKPHMIEITNEISDALDYDFPASVQSPLDAGVSATEFISIFLNEIFFSVNGVLVMLAIMLIYSLLLSDVEEKTFEYGMLRTLGLRQKSLINLLSIQAFYFSLPGILFGFLVCYLIYIPIDFIVAIFAYIPMTPNLRQSAILLGVILGTILPFLGMMLPIRRALGQTLRDALDFYHKNVYDSVVKIEKLQSLGFSFTETIVSIVLVLMGFLVYYLVPLSFLFNNIQMFLRILTIILLAMVVGEVMLSQGADYYLEKMFVWLIVWGKDRKLVHIVLKNLAGHRPRNKKTTIMFTLCLGFVIFSATMFTLQAKSIPQNLEWASGADIVGISLDYEKPLPEEDLRSYLNSVLFSNLSDNQVENQRKIVIGYTFLTFPLRDSQTIISTSVSSTSSIEGRSVSVLGVEDNYLDVTYNNYYIISEIDSSISFPLSRENKLDSIKGLYQFSSQITPKIPPIILVSGDKKDEREEKLEKLANETQRVYENTFPVIISESLRNAIFVDTHSQILFRMSHEYLNPTDDIRYTKDIYFSAKPIAMLKKMPGLTGFNRLQDSDSPVLITMEQYQSLTNRAFQDSNDTLAENPPKPKKKTLLVRVLQNSTDIQIEGLVNGINSLLSDIGGQVSNLRKQVDQTKLASFLIIVFFDIVAVVGLIFSFFVLWLSFTANVRENAWEYGVLRALGLESFTVLRLYIYEAISLVLSSIVLGTALGIFTAVILTLQINIFSELPFVFNFPNELFALVVVFSLLVAVLGSYFPAEEVRKKEIAIALRG